MQSPRQSANRVSRIAVTQNGTTHSTCGTHQRGSITFYFAYLRAVWSGNTYHFGYGSPCQNSEKDCKYWTTPLLGRYREENRKTKASSAAEIQSCCMSENCCASRKVCTFYAKISFLASFDLMFESQNISSYISVHLPIRKSLIEAGKVSIYSCFLHIEIRHLYLNSKRCG